MILVLSVNEAHLLERSLPAAVAQGEVLVVDNACTDATAELARRHGARVLRLETRASYAVAVNAGLVALRDAPTLPRGAERRADWVLLLNADCFLDPGYLDAVLPHLDDRTVGSVSGLLRIDGTERVDCAGMWLDRRRKNGLVGHGDPLSAHAEPGEVFGVDGACALYRREALAGGLDEDMALWITDVDLAWRARRAGWRCVYEPRATAAHIRTYSPTKRAQTSEAHRRTQFRNRYLMMVRNETPRSLLRNLPWIAVYELLALGHVILRERFLARGYLEALRLGPRVFARR